jgi:phage tail sheath protein FI
MDHEKGFWWSPSNQVINGIVGTSRPVGWSIGDPHSEANWLNEREITTIIRREGFRLWGNRTTSADPQWAFLSVRRTADMVYEAVERAFLWAMDRPLSPQLVLDIQESVNAYLRTLKARGAILGGRCWLDPELNTPAELMAGHLTLDFDIEPPAPMERLTFRAHRDAGYYTELVDAVIREAA